jgi:hypothetical protein
MLPKHAYDEEFGQCSPGHLLVQEVIKDAFSRSELCEINPMSDSDTARQWAMHPEQYTDLHLVRRSALAVLLERPKPMLKSVYHTHVQPRIPTLVKGAFRKSKRLRNRRLDNRS